MNGAKRLPPGWEARLGLNGRIYYYSKRSQIVQILPPPETWRCKHCLPYGWEMAVDYDNRNYYINHLTQTVNYEDPRTEDDQANSSSHLSPSTPPPPDLLMSPQPREYIIDRDSEMGFGFIAGSEKPVVIRSVTAGGPSEGKLLPDDEILKIGRENVLHAHKDRIIELIRRESQQVSITVLQPIRSASSSFRNPAKKTFRTSDRLKVRFADDVIVNGQERSEGSSSLLISPGTWRVELEHKETKAFELLSDPTAGDVVATLCQQMGFKDPNLFSLVLCPSAETDDNCGSDKSVKSSYSSVTSDSAPMTSSSEDLILVAPWESLAKFQHFTQADAGDGQADNVATQVAANPSLRQHFCYLRLEFLPKDLHVLSRNDPEAFRYLYIQCVNDVVTGERYKCDLSREDYIKLAALQMLELFFCAMPDTPPEIKISSPTADSPLQRNSFRFQVSTNKLTTKYFEKEHGLKKFLPPSILDAMKKDSNTAKFIKKSIQQHMKMTYSSFFNEHPTSPISPSSPNLMIGMNRDTGLYQARLRYLKILSPQHLFGGRFFSVSMLALMESDIAILVGRHYGISQLINAKTRMVSVLAEFQHVKELEVSSCRPDSSSTSVKIQFTRKKDIRFTMGHQDAHKFALMVAGYCRVYGNTNMVLTLPLVEATTAPTYFGPHTVKPSNWNYPRLTDFDAATDDLPPPFFHCDFSEPVTPRLLSQDTPALANFGQKSINHRPPTPPPSSPLPDEDDEDDEDQVFISNRVDEADTNNNDSTLIGKSGSGVVYETITTSLSKEKDISHLPSPDTRGGDHAENSLRDDFCDVTLEDTSAKESTSGNIPRDYSSDGFDERAQATANVITVRADVNSDSVPDTHFFEAPSPPDYPTPRRKDIEVQQSSRLNSTKKDEVETDTVRPVETTNHEAKFETELHSTNLSVKEADHTHRNPELEPLEDFEDVKDPETIKKLREAADLMEYFRQRNREVSSASSGTDGVSDLAAGNKRLRRAEKAAIKNRKSWAGTDNLPMAEDPVSMSVSNPDLSSVSGHKKRDRGFFWKFFGNRRKRPVSMYDSKGSAYGRRKRRFRMPRLRLKKAFSLKPSRKSNRKSVLPDASSDEPVAASRFRLFSSRKGKSHGMLVISEPCDDVRGVDLLPSGRYTVAGSMFNGDSRDPEVITLHSKENSIENLTEVGLVESPRPLESTSKVRMRSADGSLRAKKRPVSFFTFQQSDAETAVDSQATRVRSSSTEHLSPCELSQTESTEALHELIPVAREPGLRIVKPPRQVISLRNSSASDNSTELIVDNVPEHLIISRTPAIQIKKRPSAKRPAPAPPAPPSQTNSPSQGSDDVTVAPVNQENDSFDDTEPIADTVDNAELATSSVDSAEPAEDELSEGLQNGLEDDSHFSDPRSDDSVSLVTEIFSYLNSNSEREASSIPELPDDTALESNTSQNEKSLLYDDSYSMPGVKSHAMKVKRMEDSTDKTTSAAEQQALFDILRSEMIADNSRLTLGEPEDQVSSSVDSDVTDDDDRHGSYDVTVSDESDDGKNVSTGDDVVLKSYASTEGSTARERENSYEVFEKRQNVPRKAVIAESPTTFDGQVASISDKKARTETNTSGGMKTGLETELDSSAAAKTSGNAGRVSYLSYGNLVSPTGFVKGVTGAKRTPISRPPLPPKPVFH